MNTRIFAFGIVKDFFGSSVIEVNIVDGTTINELKSLLEQQYPALRELSSYVIAVNDEYASSDIIIKANDEIAIIPPVSGG